MRHLTLTPDEVRTADDGTLEFDGIAAPYETPIEYAGITEQFARGAFDPATVVGAPLLWSHDRAEPVGHITKADDTPVGLAITATVLPTSRGRDAITLLRGGSLRGLSVGFQPDEMQNTPHGVTYTRASLIELSLTATPAYQDAAVASVRSEEKEEVTMPEETREAVDLAPIQDRLDALETRMTAPAPEPVRHLTVVEAFTRQIADGSEHAGRHIRALADVVSSGNSGVLPPAWSSEVVNYVDTQRYMFANTGTLAFPMTGHTLTIPYVSQETLVGPRGSEKTEIPSQALTTSETTYTADWYAGGVDVALEVIWQSSPSVWSLVVESILGQYAVVTDQALTLALETAATPVGAALDFTDYGTFSAQVITQAEVIRANTGAPGDKLSLTTASFQALLGLRDGDGRRSLSTIGSTNADGSAGFLAQTVNVGGVQCFHNPRAAEDLQYNEKSARKAEKPPVTLTSDNVALMGRDIGVIGAMIPLPVYATGLFVYSAA